MTAAATSRVKVKTPKSGSERLELVLLESDNNKSSISSTPNMMQSTPQPYQQSTTAVEETRNDTNTSSYLPQQYNNEMNNNNNIDDNSSYLTGCSASTVETDNRASAYRNSSIESLDQSWSREYTDANDTRETRGGREESDLYGSLKQCESIININNVLPNGGGVSRSSSPVNSEPVAKNEQPAVDEATNTTAAVESEETSSQQSPHPTTQSSPTNLQYKKSVSFDQSLDELLASATTTTSEEKSSSSSSAASDTDKNKKKKGKKKKISGQSSVKSEDTSVESVGHKVKTTFGSSGKKKSTSSSLKQATPSKGVDNTSNDIEEDQENNPSLSSQQQQQKKNRRKSAPKVLRVSKYSKQTSTSSSLTASSSKAVDTASDRGGPVDVDEVEVKATTKGKRSSSSTRANDVESACSVVTEPLLDVLMREEQKQNQNVKDEHNIPEVVQNQEKSVTRRELRKQRSRVLYDNDRRYDQGNSNSNQQQSRLQHRRTLPRDHPNYQSSQRDQYQYRGDDNQSQSLQRSNSNISNATSLYSAYSNVALDGYVEPTNLTNSRRKKKEKREKKGFFRKGARVAVKGVKGGKKLGSKFIKKVKDWYEEEDDEEEYDVDDYGGYIGGGDEYRRDQEDGRANDESSRRDSSNPPFDTQYSFEGYDHLKSPRNIPRGGTPSPQGNGTLTNPWSGIGGPQDQQGGQKVSPNFVNNINPWSGIQTSAPQVDATQQQQGEYNQDGMPSIKWWTWKQKKKSQQRPVTTAAVDDEDETSNESMEYTYFAFLSKTPV